MFKKATRAAAKIKLAITGPSGSGKTYSSLLLAKGLGSKIAVIDTENGSASLYSDSLDFDTMTISPPYTTEKYMAAIDAAVAANYDTLIIDSITHAWSGEGGLLAQKEQLDSRGGNSYTNWAKITPRHEAFMAKILHSPIHLIATMRSKQDYVLADKNGKQVPQKVGMAPVQRDGAEYEFTTVFDVAMNHEAAASKDRTGIFDGKIFKINEATGKEILTWLNSASDAANKEVPKESAPPKTTKPKKEKPQPEKADDPGEYISRIGKIGGPILGKKVKEINPADLMAFMTYLVGNDIQKPPAAFLSKTETKEFFNNAEKFINANPQTFSHT